MSLSIFRFFFPLKYFKLLNHITNNPNNPHTNNQTIVAKQDATDGIQDNIAGAMARFLNLALNGVGLFNFYFKKILF